MENQTLKAGQTGRLDWGVVRGYCGMPPYLKLVKKCEDEDGLVTVEEVNEDKQTADIGNLLGGVWVPLGAIKPTS